MLQQVLGLGVNVQLAALRVLSEVESRDLGDVLILALSLLLLQLEGDTTDGSSLNTLHQVCSVAGNLCEEKLGFETGCSRKWLEGVADLVAQALGRNDGDLIADSLVGLEVQGELGVVPLNDDLGGLLDGLCANATHFGGCGCRIVGGEG